MSNAFAFTECDLVCPFQSGSLTLSNAASGTTISTGASEPIMSTATPGIITTAASVSTPPTESQCASCVSFIKWIGKNSKGAGTYYDNDNNLKSDGFTCTTGVKCASSADYWFEDGTKSYYWDSGLLGGTWKEYKDCGIPCGKFDYFSPTSSVSENTTKTKWCAYFTLQKILGGDACNYMTYYATTFYNMINPDCALVDGGVEPDHLEAFYSHYLNLTPASISSECDMVNALKGKDAYIIDVSPNHVSTVYGIKREKDGEYRLHIFSTNNPVRWDNTSANFSDYDLGGPDYVAK